MRTEKIVSGPIKTIYNEYELELIRNEKGEKLSVLDK